MAKLTDSDKLNAVLARVEKDRRTTALLENTRDARMQACAEAWFDIRDLQVKIRTGKLKPDLRDRLKLQEIVLRYTSPASATNNVLVVNSPSDLPGANPGESESDFTARTVLQRLELLAAQNNPDSSETAPQEPLTAAQPNETHSGGTFLPSSSPHAPISYKNQLSIVVDADPEPTIGAGALPRTKRTRAGESRAALRARQEAV